MPTVTGTVKQIFVSSATCCVTIDQTSGPDKVVLLWSYPTQEDNATNRLTHGTYLALTRDGYVNGKIVECVIPNNSSLVTSVKIRNP